MENSWQPAFTNIALQLVQPENSRFQTPVQVNYSLDKHDLLVEFQVNAPVLFKKDIYATGDFPYEFDVTEVFLTFDDVVNTSKFSYFEYEITPLGQTYHLRLDVENGQRRATELPSIEATARSTATSWATSMRIPLESFQQPVDLSRLKGNFYAILGNEPRTYWSAFLPQQDVANFHKPEYFKNLLKKKNAF